MDLISRTVSKGTAAVGAVGKGVVGVGQGVGKGVMGVSKGVGQGVVGVSKGVGQGVVGVSKGVGQGVVGVSKGVGQGVVDVSKGVGQGVVGVGKGAIDVGSAAGNVVGKGVVGVGQGVVGVGMGASNAIGKGVVGVGQGVVDVGKGAVGVGAAAANAGVNVTKAAATASVSAATTAGSAVGTSAKIAANVSVTAASAGVGAVGAVGGTAARTISKTTSRSLSPRRTNTGSRRQGIQTYMEIFCSDFYTEQFVLDEIAKAKKDKNIVSIHFEDLIMRETPSPKMVQAVIELLDATAKLPEIMESDDSQTDDATRSRRPSGGKDKIMRVWTGVTFCECISSSMDYEMYHDRKERLLQKLMAQNNIKITIPMKFETKIELHSMMGVSDVIDVLTEIEKDETITGIDFPMYPRDHKQVPSYFVENFDTEAKEWKSDASPINIKIRYGKLDNLSFEDDSGHLGTGKQKNPTRVITTCKKVLEEAPDAVMDANNESFSWNEDNEILNSELTPEERKRIKRKSSGAPKPRKSRGEGGKASRTLSPKDGKPRRRSGESKSRTPSPKQPSVDGAPRRSARTSASEKKKVPKKSASMDGRPKTQSPRKSRGVPSKSKSVDGGLRTSPKKRSAIKKVDEGETDIQNLPLGQSCNNQPTNQLAKCA